MGAMPENLAPNGLSNFARQLLQDSNNNNAQQPTGKPRATRKDYALISSDVKNKQRVPWLQSREFL